MYTGKLVFAQAMAHLPLPSFIWIAVSVYSLIAILKKRLDSRLSLYTIMQILSVTIFEKTSLNQLLNNPRLIENQTRNHNQLNLFDY